MSNTPTRSIALTKELDAFIKAEVESGRYTSASEVVRQGLRMMVERKPVGSRRSRQVFSSASSE